MCTVVPYHRLRASMTTNWGAIALDNSPETKEAINFLCYEIDPKNRPSDFPVFNMDYLPIMYENEVRMWRADNLSRAEEMMKTKPQPKKVTPQPNKTKPKPKKVTPQPKKTKPQPKKAKPQPKISRKSVIA